MKTKFTPGPWEAYRVGRSHFCIGENGSSKWALADLWRGDQKGSLPMKQFEANAALIAASPKLYESCKQAISLIENSEHGLEYQFNREIRELLLKAIAKAEGREVSNGS